MAFDVEGSEEGFRQREEKIINELTEKQGIVLAKGGGVWRNQEKPCNRLSGNGGVVVYFRKPTLKTTCRTSEIKKRPFIARC